MDSAEIIQLRRELDSARKVPERAIAVLLDSMDRICGHMESEREARNGMRDSISKFERMICGWNDNDGKRHAGLIDSITKMEETNERGRKQSEDNAATLKKIFVTIVCSALTALILYIAGKVRFGP